MPKPKALAGVLATTHRDKHGEQLSKEHLEAMLNEIHGRDSPAWIYWDHQTTLPPVGLITSAKVDLREDGEYQLTFESELLDSDSYVALPQSLTKGLDVSEAELRSRIPAPSIQPDGELILLFDPRNFDESDVKDALGEIKELLPATHAQYVRKAEVPHPVIWFLVGWAGGQILSGFFTKMGEVAAETFLAASRESFTRLNKTVASLLKKSKGGNRPDVIFKFPQAQGGLFVEAVLERADEDTLQRVWEEIPLVHSMAQTLVERNRPGYFAEMKFLFNPTSGKWEINYLITRQGRQVVLGPRYYLPSHPLHKRWEEGQPKPPAP